MKMTETEENAWIEAGLQCDGMDWDDWGKEAVVRYGRLLNGGMNEAGEAILLRAIKSLETLNEHQAQVIHDLRIENSGQAAEIEQLKSTICSGGSGGKSTYQHGSVGATTSLPPETRITVNGKTFTLGDIDKEMTK